MSKSSEELRDILQVIKDEGAEVGNIDVVMNVGGFYLPTPGTSTDPGGDGSGNEPPKPEYPKSWHLLTIYEVDGKGKKTAVLLRTPDTQDGNKLGVNNDTEVIVYETLPPQTIKKDGGTKIWRTELELKNVLENWAYFEDQIVKNWNGKFKWLLDYPRIGKADGEFGTGAFVLRKYLRKA